MRNKKSKNFYTDIYSFFIKKKKIDKIRLENIFSKLKIDSTFKTTSFNRMNDINKKLNNHIKKNLPKKIMICDLGVRIGKNTFIKAGSVVTKSTEPNSIICGNPQKIEGYLTEELIQKINNSNKDNFD